jgi:type IV secretion system protein VirB10
MQGTGMPAVTRLRVGRLLLLGSGALLLVGGLAWLLLRTHSAAPVATAQDATPVWPAWMRQPLVYAAPEPPRPSPPVAIPVDHTADELRALQEQLDATKQELAALREQRTKTPAPAAQTVSHPQGTPPATSATRWQVVSRQRQRPSEERRRRDEQSEDLIQHANWQMPDDPLKTLYMSMLLPVRLEDAVRSDQPGIAVGSTTIPIFDKFGYGQMILDKGTKVVWTQEAVPTFGQTVLPLAIQQLELPSGEIWKVKGGAADSEGRMGLTGKVENHYGKLFLATAVNAALSLGVNSLAGTPSGFYPDPFQQAAREATSSVSTDVRSIVRQQLKVPPTIHLRKGELHTIRLLENVSFSRDARPLD